MTENKEILNEGINNNLANSILLKMEISLKSIYQDIN